MGLSVALGLSRPWSVFGNVILAAPVANVSGQVRLIYSYTPAGREECLVSGANGGREIKSFNRRHLSQEASESLSPTEDQPIGGRPLACRCVGFESSPISRVDTAYFI